MTGYFVSRVVEVITLAAWGAVMGSFLYVVALNVGQLNKIVRRRSACPHCGHELSWFELIPFVSYLVQRGRCRACSGRLSRAYFWSEVGVAGLFASLYWWVEPASFGALIWLLLTVSGWFVLFVDDWRTMSVDMGFFWRLVWFVAVIGAVVNVVAGHVGWWVPIVGALIVAGVLWVIRIVGTLIMKQEAMGDGDPPVGALVGLTVAAYSGLGSVVLTLLLSFIIGSVIGLVPMIWQRRFDSMKEVPFTPALFLAGWLALLWGQTIIDWYLGML